MRASPIEILEGRTDYFWAGDDLLAEARGESLTEYAMWGFVAEALWENGALRHVVNSQQGVPQELLDEKGKLVWQGTFDDWGKLIDESGTTTCRLRLLGQIADDETGLHYNRFRYYTPRGSQFMSADPIGFGGGFNQYRFAPNTIGWADPLGLTCEVNHTKPIVARINVDDLPAEEAAALKRTLAHIAGGTTPTGPTATKWGTKFKNWDGDLPGPSGPTSPFKEYRVAPAPGESGAGSRRVVTDPSSGRAYYTWTHYGDSGNPTFVRLK